jgi:uncharacterized protein (TIGR00369 family)
MTSKKIDQELFEAISTIYNEKVPFNEVLGLHVESLHYDRVSIRFEMREELVGNFLRGNLHGGVISTVIDVTGSLSAFMGLQEKLTGKTLDEKMAHIGKLGTIDLRVDYLRPGVGQWFVCTAHTLRTGNKVAVTRSELRDDSDDLIAVGTGSYVIS